MTAAAVALSSEWVVSVHVLFHDTDAADVGCLAVEDALGGQAALLHPDASRLGGRRVRVVFGIVAGSAGDAIADACALLVARLFDVRPIPLWVPASLTARPAQG